MNPFHIHLHHQADHWLIDDEAVAPRLNRSGTDGIQQLLNRTIHPEPREQTNLKSESFDELLRSWIVIPGFIISYHWAPAQWWLTGSCRVAFVEKLQCVCCNQKTVIYVSGHFSLCCVLPQINQSSRSFVMSQLTPFPRSWTNHEQPDAETQANTRIYWEF